MEYEGIYKISNLGRRKNKKCEIQRCRIKKGYNTARLCKKGVYKDFLAHRLVGIAFIPNPDNLPEINHIGLYEDGREGNKLDNRAVSLKWSTKSNNGLHAWANGLSKPRLGKDNNLTKLTEKQVLEIRELYSTGKHFQREIAGLYDVKQPCVYKIVNNISWKHIL